MSRDRHENLHEWDAPLSVRTELADEYLLSIAHSHTISADHAEGKNMMDWHRLQASIATHARAALQEVTAEFREHLGGEE